MKKTLLVALLALPSCGIPKTHIVAERAIYDALEPDFRGYVESDESLTESQKKLKMRTLARWDEMISAFEEDK